MWIQALAVAATSLVSISSSGAPGDFDSGGAGLSAATRSEVAISGDGRFVAFESLAGTLAPGDTNNRGDVFVRDRATGTTVLASVGSDGRQETGQSSQGADLSRDGRYLAFSSYGKLESADTNGAGDIYVRDLVAGTTTRVSVGTDGQQGDNSSMNPSMSPDGRFIAFSSIATTLTPQDPDNLEDVYLRDRDTDADGVMDEPGAVQTALVSVGSDGRKELTTNQFPAVSADGRFVAFQTLADEWVPGDGNRADDIYVRDVTGGTTTRVSVGMNGADADHESNEPAISDDGRHVIFSSQATNLVPGDTNEVRDVFAADRGTGAITRVSVSSDETQADGGRSMDPSVSPDGNVVVFASEAGGLAEDSVHPDIYVRDRSAGVTALVNLAADNGPADASSWAPVISDDKQWIAFASFASNYVQGDANNKFDVFVRGPFTGATAGGATATLRARPAVKVSKLGRGFAVGFTHSGAGTLTLTGRVPAVLARKARLGGRVVVRGTATTRAAGTSAIRLAATKAGRRLAATGRVARISLTGSFEGAPVTGAVQLKR